VSEVRELIRSIGGFGALEIVEREENLGLARSIIDGVTDASSRFGKAIVVEDDIVVSPYFLRFMNEALARYEHDQRVSSISGYMYPVTGQLPDQFFLRLTECWGWATWDRAWRAFEPDGAKLLSEIKTKGLESEFNVDGAMDLVGMLTKQISGAVDSWAVRWNATNFLLRRLTFYPRVSMTRNIGNDGSGEHGGFTNIFDVEVAQMPLELRAIPVEENDLARRAVVDFLACSRPTLFERARVRLGRWVTALSRHPFD
jgi:hypothetical protein